MMIDYNSFNEFFAISFVDNNCKNLIQISQLRVKGIKA